MPAHSNNRQAVYSAIVVFLVLSLFVGSGLVPSASASKSNPVQTEPSPTPTRQPTVEPQKVGVPREPIPAQVIIQFAPNTTDKERVAYIESLGGAIVKDIGSLDTVVVNVPETIANAPLPESPLVAETEPDYYVSALDDVIPNDPRYPEQWALPAIGASSAWGQIPVDAPKVAVAVIDSGICASHTDLAGRILDGWDFLESDAVPQDDFGHGCSVSGVIAANMNDGTGIAGVAPNAQIMPLRVLNASGVGSYSDVAAAIVYAADHDAQVVNLSLGGSNPSSTLENAVNYAISKGVILVAAAGNNGTEGALYPAAYPDVIAVGSVDPNLEHSSFSNYGSQVDIWAPGRDILTTKRDGGYGLVSGTSFAAPYMAGAEALTLLLSTQLNQQNGVLWLGSQVIDTPTLTTEPQATEPEGGAIAITTDTVSAQISVGGCAIVTNSNSAGGLAVRPSPGSTTLIKRIPDGTIVTITGGPATANGLTWWQHNQGGWSAESQNGVRYLTDTSCSGGGGGNLVLIQDLSYSPSNPAVNQSINATFRVKNTGGQAITLQYLGVQVRLNGDLNSTNRDFNWDQNITLQPNQEYTYSSNRSIDIAGSWTFRPNFQMNGQWSDVHRANGTVNTVWVTVQSAPPPPPPGNLVLTQDLAISPTSPSVNQNITATFKVKNTGGQAMTLQNLGVQVRLNGDLNSTSRDFNWVQNLTLQPNQEYTYSSSRGIDIAGSWTFRPNFQMNGQWSDVHRANGTVNTMWVTIQNVTPPGQLTLTQDLSLSNLSPIINQTNVTATYKVKNTGGQAITLQNLGVQVRLNGDLNSTNRDFNWIQNLTLQPNEEYTYSSSRTFDVLGSWTARPNFQMNGVWSDVHRADNTVNTVWFTVQNPPPPPAGNIQIYSGLQLSPSNPTPGQNVNAQVTVKNNGGTTFTAPYFGIKGRYTNGDLNYDYGWIQNFSLAAGATYTFNGNRAFDRTGNYWFTANYQDSSGTWNDVKWSNGSTNYVNLTVGSVVVNPGCFTVSISSSNGSVARDKAGNCNSGNGYLEGTILRLTASPNNGYAFSGWAGAASGTANPIYITITGNTSITANFVQASTTCYTLTINAVNGTVDRAIQSGSTCGAGYTAGSQISLTANPNSGFSFSGWTGDINNSGITTNIIMNSNKNVTASFMSNNSQSPKPVVVLVRGWGGVDSVDHHCTTQPSHQPGNYFGDLPQNLVGRNYDVWEVNIDTGPSGTPSIEDNASCLETQLNSLQTNPNVKHSSYILVAHSMGGLISRAYLEGALGYTPTIVSTLITVGTPHTGATLGYLACLRHILTDKAACEFSPLGATLFDARYNNRNPNVNYYFIGGDPSPTVQPIFIDGKPLELSWQIDGPHDGVVGLASSVGDVYYRLGADPVFVGGALRYRVSETHIDEPVWPQSYFQPRGVGTTATEDCIVEILTSGYCNADNVAIGQANATGVNDSVQIIPNQTGHLNTNQNIQMALPLDDVGQSTVQLSWVSGTVSLTLISPQGITINPAYATAHPTEVTYQSGGDSSGQFAAYTLQISQPGVYTARIVGGSLGTSGTDYTLTSAVQSPRILSVTTDQSFYSVGDTIVITANLLGSSGPLNGATTQARINLYSGAVVNVPMFETGGGTYQGTYPVSNVPGLGLVTVTAQGSDNGISYARQSSIDFMISPSNVSLSGHYSDGMSDSDGNGLYDSLDVAVGVSASLAQGAEVGATAVGDYTVAADLVDGNGNIIAHANTESTLPPGKSDVVLPFNGDEIRASGTSGPYTLTNITIVDQQTSAPAVWNVVDAWTTGAYDPQNFGNSCFVLKLNVSGNGTVLADPQPNCNNGLQYAVGTVITLTAVEDAGDSFTNWSGDVESSSATEAVTIRRDSNITANFNAPNSVFPLKAFTVPSTQAASLNDTTNLPRKFAASDLQSASVQGYYNAGDDIELVLRTQNTTGADATATFSWYVTDPVGRIVYDLGWDGNLTTSNGVVDWYLSRTLPSHSITGIYTFTGEITYNGRTSAQSSTFYVSGPPGPANDNFGSIQLISTMPYAGSLDTWGAATAFSDPTPTCGYDKNSNSVWYQYTAPANGLLEVDTWGSDYDTVVAVWKGSLGSLVEVDCNDDAYGYLQAWLEGTPVTAGTTYYIEVMDYGYPGGGVLQLYTNFAPSVVNNDFNTPTVIGTLPYSVTQNARGATQAGDDPILTSCNRLPGQASVWYRYTSPTNTNLILDTKGSDYDTMLAVWTGTRGNLVSVGCNDDIGSVNGTWDQDSILTVPVTAGTIYYIEASTYAGMIDIDGASAEELQNKPDTVVPSEASANSLQEQKNIVDRNGGLITDLQSGRPDDISAQFWGGNLVLNIADKFGSGWVGGVSITSDKNVVAVARPHIGGEVASYGGFSAGSLTAYVPMLFKTAYGSYDSALYVQNVHDTNIANITIKYYDSTGVLKCTKTDTIAPLSSKGYWVPTATCDSGSLPAGWVGGAVVTSNQPIVAVGRPHVAGEVMTYNGFASGSLSTYVPMLFNGAYGSYNAAFYLQNTQDTNTANLTIKYYSSDGTLNCTTTDTLAPLASKGYWVPSATCDTGSLPAGWVGGVVVTSSQPIVAVGRPHIGTQVTTYNGFPAGNLSSYVPMLFKGAFGSYDSAFYLQNTHDTNTASITIQYYDSNGNLNCTKTDTIAPLASKGYWVPSATCDTGSLPAGWVGGVVVTSDQPIVAVGRPHLGTQITTYNGFTSGSLSSSLPMLFKAAFGGSYNAAFYVQNTENSAVAVTIKFYDTSGALSCTRSETIPALSTFGFWVPSVACDP